MALNREALQSAELKTEEVETSAGAVIVRELSTRDRDAYEMSVLVKIDTEERARRSGDALKLRAPAI